MKAAIMQGYGKPLEIVDVAKPDVRSGEAVVKLNVTGVCRTDVHQLRGDWPGIKRIMDDNHVRVLGHEGVGTVYDVDKNSTFLRTGDRVGVPWLNYWCGHCDLCLSGNPHWCDNCKITSVHSDGTYAEYVRVTERTAPIIPNQITDEEAAPLLCGGVTAYGAIKKLVKELGVMPGKRVAVMGAAGGLGHYAVQFLKAFGYTVVGIDVGRERLEFVSKLGADETVDANDAEALLKKSGKVSAALVFTPKLSGYNLAVKLLAKMGAIIAVGVPDIKEGSIDFPPIELVESGIRIVPSLVGVANEFQDVFDLYVQGKIRSHLSVRGELSDINGILERLEKSQYVARAVITI